MRVLASFVVVMMFTAVPAFAGEVEDAQTVAAGQKELAEAVTKFNEACQTNITATYALETEKYERERFDATNTKWKYEPNPTSGQFRLVKGFGYSSCACQLERLASDCTKDTFKAFVAAKIKTFQCEFKHQNRYEMELLETWDKKRKAPAGMQLFEVDAQADRVRYEYADGVLKSQFDSDMTNCGTFLSKYVNRKLGFADEEGLRTAKARFDETLSDMNEKCGTAITASYDLATEKLERERFDEVNKKWFIEPNPIGGQFQLHPGYGYQSCACTFEGMARSCAKDAFKAALKKKVSKVECEHRFLVKYERENDELYNKKRKLPKGMETWEVDAQRDSIRHELKGKTLKTYIDADTANCGSFTSKWLEKKL